MHVSSPQQRIKPLREKCCKQCSEHFQPFQSTQKVCSIACARMYAKAEADKKAEKARREQLAADRKRMRSRGEWLGEVEKHFNAWIRERDRYQPCISCGTQKPTIQYAAGHYRTVGACPELRFEPLNVHKQCNKNCNLERSGNIVEYRIGLVKRIGVENVEWIEGTHAPKKYTIDDCKRMISRYKQLTRDLKRSRA